MSLCINPQCHQRQNADDALICQTCGTSLMVEQRYWLVRSLRDLTLSNNTEVYEVIDLQPAQPPKILKVLIKNDPKLIQLFEQEQALLTNPKLHHPGIPKGEVAFSVKLADGQTLRCLVMEQIVGQDLAQWLSKNGTISEAQARNWLQQLAEILDFLHGHRWFHRDIKPANIMRKPDGHLVLIDFGTARQVTTTVVSGDPTTKVSSYGYTSPEQENGRATPQSDFYALGKTFIHLLTGEHPASAKLETHNWRTLTPYPISKSLANLLDRLVQFYPHRRPRNAQAILRRLQWLEMERYWRWLVAALALAGLGGWTIGKFSLVERAIGLLESPSVCDLQLGDALSCGEEILTPQLISREKWEATKAWKAGDYRKAIAQWNKALRAKKNDPEALIYRNNAQLMVDRRNTKTIAVAVPLNSFDATSASGLEILRGVAQAQDVALKKGIYIKVMIGDDANTADQAQTIAQAFSQKPDLLAVVGHYASEISLSVVPIYQARQLVIISPTSSSTNLSSWGNLPQHTFFRTVSTTQKTALALAGYLNSLPPQKTAIFYNHQSDYSRSIREQFVLTMPKQRLLELPEFDLSRPTFNPKTLLRQVKEGGATAIALFPDGHTNPYAFGNAIKLFQASQTPHLFLGSESIYGDTLLQNIEQNAQQWRILGGPMLYSPEFLRQLDPKQLTQFVLAVPWHYSENLSFARSTRQYWGVKANWRTATAYDAVQVLLKAFQQHPRDRRALQQILAHPDFVAQGATGSIHFTGGDRREPLTTLGKVMNCPKLGDTYGYTVVSIELDRCPTE